jgi:hypothetical protein
MLRAAADIEPVSRMLSSKAALPGPMRAPESKWIESLIWAMCLLLKAPRTTADTTRLLPVFPWDRPNEVGPEVEASPLRLRRHGA